MTTPNHPPSCGHDAPTLSVVEAQQRIQSVITPIAGKHRLSLRAALGHVLAEPIIAPAAVPPQDNSAMDGYALCHSDQDTPHLHTIGTAFAGHPFDGALQAGECVRIMTGAVIPAGADAVVMQERVAANGETITVQHWPELGENIRRAGEDLQAGATLLPAGRRLTAADLGVVASAGRADVSVMRPLRVAFFSTGDELRSVGEPLGPGEIYDSNRYTLYGMLTLLGVEVLDMGVVSDDRGALASALDQAANQADVILSSGGVSVGEADFMDELLGAQGSVYFSSVAMKPGRPLTFGQYRGAWYFGLPGNPVSVMATVSQIVAPTLRTLAGETPQSTPRFQARCLNRLRKRPGRQEFQRARLIAQENGVMAVEGLGHQGSGVLRSMSEADCFIVLPAESSDVDAGDWVTVEPFTRPLR